jgi:hypothetical protein
VPQFINFGDHASHMQQRLRRYTSAKKTRPPEPRIGFDNRNFQTLISRQERRRITTWTTAENNNWAMHIKAATSGRGLMCHKIKEPKNQEPK